MTGALPFEQEWFQSYSTLMAKLRLGQAILVTMFIWLIDPGPNHIAGMVWSVIYIAYAVLLLAWPQMRFALLAKRLYLLLTIDIILLTILILQSGHPQGWALVFYLIPIAAIAIRYGWKKSLTTGLFCIVVHTAAVWWVYGVLPNLPLFYLEGCWMLFGPCCAMLAAKEREQAIHYAVTDGLTNLYNYRFFQQMLSHALKLAERSQLGVTLLLLDVDDFKRINDTYGHVSGDYALQHIAGVIRQSVRGTDIIARYGGEEFAVILIDCELSYGQEIGQRICSTLEYCPCEANGQDIHLSVSIGAACYPDQAIDKTQLIDCADQALYYAKRNGKNRVVLYQGGMEPIFPGPSL